MSNTANLRAVTTPNVYGRSMNQHGMVRDNVFEMNPVEPRPTPAVNGSEYANVPVSVECTRLHRWTQRVLPMTPHVSTKTSDHIHNNEHTINK